jgi:carotenoid cleavage dioxygenase
VFAPSRDGGAEDEGYVMTIVHDTATEQSRLVIIDARDFSAPPVATVYLPQRVPYGAHGSWVPSTSVAM